MHYNKIKNELVKFVGSLGEAAGIVCVKSFKVEIVSYAQRIERRHAWLESNSQKGRQVAIKVRKSGRDQITQDLVGPGSLQT